MPKEGTSGDPATSWSKLQAIAAVHRDRTPSSYFEDEAWLDSANLETDGLCIDWSMQRLDREAFGLLCDLANEMGVSDYLRRQLSGEEVNPTEQRAALHTANRGTQTSNPELDRHFADSRNQVLDFASSVLDGRIRAFGDESFTDVVHIGIGGSHLGQAFVCDALHTTHLNVHFLSNTNPQRRSELLASLKPSRTLVIVASKSFSTDETLQHYHAIQDWFVERTGEPSSLVRNFAIVTANDEAVKDLSCAKFIIPQEIGGRFSLWSAMGLPVALSIGTYQFIELLAGARSMDVHVASTETSENAAFILALLTVWNSNCLGTSSHVVLPYNPKLERLPGHLQQLEMESLGKSHQTSSSPINVRTTPVIWGGPETDGQHAWHQWLHQGTHQFSADFIASSEQSDSNQWMLSNCLAQQHLMFAGHVDSTAPHKTVAGGHGSTLILLDKLDAHGIGKLIALYEHKVACLGHLWGVNTFDQWGVERGKVIAKEIYGALTKDSRNIGNKLLDKRVRKIVAKSKSWQSTG